VKTGEILGKWMVNRRVMHGINKLAVNQYVMKLFNIIVWFSGSG